MVKFFLVPKYSWTPQTSEQNRVRNGTPCNWKEYVTIAKFWHEDRRFESWTWRPHFDGGKLL